MENIGQTIRNLRTQNRLSADELAELLGKVSANRKQYVYDLENGKIKRVKLEIIKLLSEIFKVPMSEFVSFNTVVFDKKNQINTVAPVNDIEHWQQKYYEAIEEINQLKSRIIQLMEEKNFQSLS